MTEQDLEKRIKQKKVRTIVLVVVALAIVAAIVISLIGKPQTKTANAEVTIEIRCDQLSKDMSRLNDKALVEYVPEDGTILPRTTWGIVSEESTVFNVLDEVCRQKEIQMEFSETPAYGGAYIEGIHYLYEKSAGKYSGWMYTVDGKTPGYGADKVKLKGGEEILWYYVVDYHGGND